MFNKNTSLPTPRGGSKEVVSGNITGIAPNSSCSVGSGGGGAEVTLQPKVKLAFSSKSSACYRDTPWGESREP